MIAVFIKIPVSSNTSQQFFGGERDFVHALGVSGVPPGNYEVGECALATLAFGFQRVTTHAFTKILIGPNLNAHAYENIRRLRRIQRELQHLSGVALVDEGPQGERARSGVAA